MNRYQKVIDAAIKRTETAERKSAEKETIINSTLKIWTKVKEFEHIAVTYFNNCDKKLKAFSSGELTEQENLSTPVSVLSNKATKHK